MSLSRFGSFAFSSHAPFSEEERQVDSPPSEALLSEEPDIAFPQPGKEFHLKVSFQIHLADMNLSGVKSCWCFLDCLFRHTSQTRFAYRS